MTRPMTGSKHRVEDLGRVESDTRWQSRPAAMLESFPFCDADMGGTPMTRIHTGGTPVPRSIPSFARRKSRDLPKFFPGGALFGGEVRGHLYVDDDVQIAAFA